MTPWTSDQIAQIRAILSHVYVGQDPWARTKLRGAQSLSDVDYAAVFSVQEDDVIRYVEQHGWDGRTVRAIPALPPEPEAVSWDWRFFLLPAQAGRWTCGRRVDTERRSDPYDLWSFDSEEAMVRFIVRDLIDEQKRFWGPQVMLPPG
jgi:hypothetical protein